jgi:hypothetical protein
MSIYGYGTEYDTEYGTGYRYPKRRRQVKTKLEEPEKFARAAIYNVGAARVNPWIQHLRNTKTFEKIRKALIEARQSYVPKPKDPERTRKALERELKILEEEYNAVHGNYPKLVDPYNTKYGSTISYENARLAAEAKLRRRATYLSKLLGKPTSVPPITGKEIDDLRTQGIL